MTDNYQCNVQYIPYKEIVKQKAIEYYHKNKEKIKEKNKNKYNSLSPEMQRPYCNPFKSISILSITFFLLILVYF